MVESGSSGSKLGGRKQIGSQGWGIIFNLYSFMIMEDRREVKKEKTFELVWILLKDFIAARNVSLNVFDVVKKAEEKFSSLSKEEWAA
jgi:hypothetical protein